MEHIVLDADFGRAVDKNFLYNRPSGGDEDSEMCRNREEEASAVGVDTENWGLCAGWYLGSDSNVMLRKMG